MPVTPVRAGFAVAGARIDTAVGDIVPYRPIDAFLPLIADNRSAGGNGEANYYRPHTVAFTGWPVIDKAVPASIPRRMFAGLPANSVTMQRYWWLFIPTVGLMVKVARRHIRNTGLRCWVTQIARRRHCFPALIGGGRTGSGNRGGDTGFPAQEETFAGCAVIAELLRSASSRSRWLPHCCQRYNNGN